MKIIELITEEINQILNLLKQDFYVQVYQLISKIKAYLKIMEKK